MKKTILYKFSSVIFFTTALLAINSCQREAVQDLPDHNWQLVWSDEFEGAAGSAPDAKNWNFDIGNGISGWGNQELEYYTSRPQNISQNGSGNLVITAKSEVYNGSQFTSSRIKTKGLFKTTYGKVEARIKTPYGPGIWPAFWMIGADEDTNSWPNCGEIDIMELRGQTPNMINGTVHGPGYSGGASITKQYGLQNDRFDKDFHRFSVEWSPNQIDFFVDDYLYQWITPEKVTGKWVFDHDFYLILNLAVGGNYVGFPTSLTPFPQEMTVDYIRVYK
ncbi:glycoside hydrolase family 16 protein [Halpernia frigidisoli]|uniref:Glycosyl hydrolases family 16 n=1 Tax=Halpernia frigidisoli TaxID=1125876 RepID=A0A1I3FUL8_9FLAO|nr:glycoside hydrolase family 16 protein [Halpernia frigidisoli]SFI14943.1 Glycosyl hydrolases family 16 [Halpernia frigidisoli]